jgi:hypothetical protein
LAVLVVLVVQAVFVDSEEQVPLVALEAAEEAEAVVEVTTDITFLILVLTLPIIRITTFTLKVAEVAVDKALAVMVALAVLLTVPMLMVTIHHTVELEQRDLVVHMAALVEQEHPNQVVPVALEEQAALIITLVLRAAMDMVLLVLLAVVQVVAQEP